MSGELHATSCAWELRMRQVARGKLRTRGSYAREVPRTGSCAREVAHAKRCARAVYIGGGSPGPDPADHPETKKNFGFGLDRPKAEN